MKKFVIALFIFFTLLNRVQAQELTDGIKFLNAQNYKRACEFFKNYTNNKPNDADGHYWIGLCYKQLGDDELSTYHLQKSYELSQTIDDVDFKTPSDLSEEDDYIDIGVMYLETKNYDMAHSYADMILKSNPQSANGYYLRARIFDEQGEIDEAKEALTRALQADNDLIESELAKKYDIKEVPPYDFEYYNSQGVCHYYRGEIDEAISCFKKSLNLNFRNPSALNNLANAYIKQNKLSEAKSILKKAQIFAPKYYQTYQNMARVAKLQSQQEDIKKLSKYKYQNEVKNYLKRAIAINPNNKYAYIALGDYYIEQKEYDDAIKNYNTALVLDEEFYEAYIGLAVAYIETNDTRHALMALRSAGALNENSDEISYYLAKMCILENKFDEAKSYLIEAADKANNPLYLLELGKIYYYKDDYQSAKNAFLKAQSLDVRFENAAELYNYLGLCFYKMHDINNAIVNLKKALDMCPDKVIYAYNLALAYKSCNQEDLYTKTYAKVTSFNPKTAQDYIDVSNIYFDKKQPQIALNIINEGLKKYPGERILYNAKLKFLQATDDKEGIEEVKRAIKTLFG